LASAALVWALPSCGSHQARAASCRGITGQAVVAPAMVTRPLALVVVLHPDGLDGPALARLTGVASAAVQRQFVALFPTDMTMPGVSAAVDRLVSAHCVDPSRVSLVGFSRGATAAAQLACRWPRPLAAVVAIAGWYATSAACAGTARHISEIHGTADGTVPLTTSAAGDWLRRWRRRFACEHARQRAAVGGLRRIAWSCPDGRVIEQVRLIGVEHGWPGEPALAPSGPYVNFNATQYALSLALSRTS
jgi:poly(3-hydroxybutyrate) depolymerase